MMTVDDVMEELGVKRSKAYSILKQLNDELAKEGYVAVRGKVPRMRIQKRNWQKFRRIIRNYLVRKKYCRGLRKDITDFYAYWGKIW